MKVDVKRISKSDLRELMLVTAEKEGWLYSVEDVEFYFHNTHSRIYSIKIKNKLAGCILLHKLGKDDLGKDIFSVGFFLIKPEYRNKNIGSALWSKTVEKRLARGLVGCLSSVSRTISYYERKGFFRQFFINSHYFLNCKDWSVFDIPFYPKENIISINPQENLKLLTDYNRTLFGHNFHEMENFTSRWSKRQDAVTFAYLAGSKIQGYGTATICHRHPDEILGLLLSFRFSPIYAENSSIAYYIICALLFHVLQNQGIYCEMNIVEEINSDFVNRIRQFGFVKSSETYLMATDGAATDPESIPDLSKVYATLPLEYPHEACRMSR